MTPSLDARFAAAVGQALGPGFPDKIGLAVSGGSDSMAMLHLAAAWARAWGPKLCVATIDHGLREGSLSEATQVAEECALLGLPHNILTWCWNGKGNLQEQARRARHALIEEWRGDVRHVLFAHTQDDQAETVLLRLARGSGADGLAAMALRRKALGFEIVRPCLGMSRAELRHYASVLRIPYVDDPSNNDPRFDRVKARQTIDALGLDRERLASTAYRMARASEALKARARDVWERIGHEGEAHGHPTGELIFDRDGFAAVEQDTQLRLLAEASCYISGNALKPREDALTKLLDRLLGGSSGTIHGCEARMEAAQLRVFRELAAYKGGQAPLSDENGAPAATNGPPPLPRVRRDISTAGDVTTAAYENANLPTLWDHRWCLVEGEQMFGCLHVSPLGQRGWENIGAGKGVAQVPFHSARSLPSLWDGKVLLACPALGVGDARFELRPFGQPGLTFAEYLSPADQG